MPQHDADVELQMRALITAGLHPDDVLDSVISEAAEGDHRGIAFCLVDFVVAHTCVAPDVGRPADMLGFVVRATLRVLAMAADVRGLDQASYHRALLTATSTAQDPHLPAAQALLAAGLCSDELLALAIAKAEPGAHAVIEALADVCLTAYADAADSDPRFLLTVLLDAALGIIRGIAKMTGCPPESVVTAYWEQLVLDP